MNGLRVSDLFKSFGSQPVLRGIDLAVSEGSFCSILGPSGSGKTTLLRVIAGFEVADRGSISLGDLVLETSSQRLSPDKRRIGYVPQDGSLFPHLSVQQNVAFGLPRGERKSKKVGELLEMVGLSELQRRYPHQLSGGQQQRVALARALAIHPSLVLLDEPFSSLDASLRASVRQDVRRALADAGATVLLVTHDQDEALSLSDKVAVIAEGRIGQSDSPAGLYAHPISPVLARGLGDANFVSGVAHGLFADTPLGSLAFEGPKFEDGSKLTVLVRPEQIDLAVNPNSNSVTAEVVEREYYGHDAIVRVRTEWLSDTPLTVRIAEVADLPEPGTKVGLSVHGSVVAWPIGKEALEPSD